MRTLLSIVLCVVSIIGFAEEPNKLIMGVRNSNFAFIGYESNQHWSARLENSMFVKQLAWQYARIYGEYRENFDKIGLEANIEPYVGSNYSGQFYDLGLRAGVSKNLGKRLFINADIIPLYDSEKGYSTCYNGSASYSVLDELALKLKFTNFPEYRSPEQRICFGLVFNSGNLQINPEITIPTEGDVRTTRINISFRYELKLKK